MKNIFKLIIALLLFCEISYSQNTWTQKANFGGIARSWSVGFSIGNKGYIGTGVDASNNPCSDIWEYDTTLNSWTQKANFGAGQRWEVTAFSIGNKGYFGTGDYYGDTNDWWEYDPSSNSWSQKATYPGGIVENAVGFSIGNKGYLGTGATYPGYTFHNDFWEYDSNNNLWTQKTNFGGVARGDAVGFAIGSKGYIGTGYSGTGPYTYYNDLWEYDVNNNSWTQKANFPGTARYRASGFATSCKGYIGSGWDVSNYYNDWWEYDPSSNAWIQIANFGGGARNNAACFSIGNVGYVGTGDNGTYKNDLWKYTPNNVSANISVSGNTSICVGGSATLSASGGVSYSWNNGATTTSVIVYPSSNTTYSVYALGYCGADTATATVAISHVALDPGYTKNICLGDTTQLAAGATASSYTWSPTGTLSNPYIVNPQAFPTTTTTYTVIATNTIGCTGIDSQMVVVHSLPQAPVITQNSNTLTTGSAFSYQWYYNGNILTGDTLQSLIVSQSGSYQVMISDSNTCSSISSPYSFLFNNIHEYNSGISFSVAPNPFNESAMLSIQISKSAAQSLEFKMYDLFGREVRAIHIEPGINALKIERGKLGKGIYIVELRQDNTAVRKLKVTIE